jgi:hypothetical protein
MPPCRRALQLALGVALAGSVALASADDAPPPSAAKPAASAAAKPATAKPREGSLGKAAGSGALMTMPQLRQCMAEQDRMAKEGADLLRAQGDFATERGEIDRLGAELKTEQASLDRTSQAAVDAYNAKLAERDKRAEAYRAATLAFNQRVEKLDVDKQAFAKECADRRYREEDYDAIKAGK